MAIHNTRGQFSTDENTIFTACRDLVERLWSLPVTRARMEAKLATLMTDVDIMFVLQATSASLKAFKDEGYRCSYSFTYDPPPPPSPFSPPARTVPVFTPPPPTATRSTAQAKAPRGPK